MGRPRAMGDGKDLKCKRIGAIKLIMYILLLVNYFSLLIILENKWLLSLYIKCIFKLFLENSNQYNNNVHDRLGLHTTSRPVHNNNAMNIKWI